MQLVTTLRANGRFVIVGLCYILLRWSQSFDRTLTRLPDSEGYLQFGTKGPLRPAVVSGMLTLAGTDHVRLWMQVAASTLTWIALAVVIALHAPRKRQALTMVIVLCLPVSSQVAGWDYLLISESLASSWLALFVLTTYAWIRQPTFNRSVLVVFAAYFWMLTKESNLITPMIVIGGIGLIPILRRLRRRQAITTTKTWAHQVFVAVALATVVAALMNRTVDRRPYLVNPAEPRLLAVSLENYRLFNILGKRVLTDPTMKKFFLERGMPQSALQFADFGAPDQNYRMYTDTALLKWTNEHGQTTLISYLVHRPWWAIRTPFRASRDLLAPDLSGYVNRQRAVLPRQLEDLFWPTEPFFVWVSFVVVIGAALIRRPTVRTAAGDLAILGGLLFAAGLISSIAAWQSDWLEPARHSYVPVLTMRLGVLLVVMSLFGNERASLVSEAPVLS